MVDLVEKQHGEAKAEANDGRGIHPFPGFPGVVTVSQRLGIQQTSEDRNRAIEQTGNPLPGIYVPNGSGGWMMLLWADVDSGDIPNGTFIKRDGNKFVGATPTVPGQASNFRQTFTDADLIAGKLTVAHGLGAVVQDVVVMDNLQKQIIPDDVDFSPGINSLIVDLAEHGTIAGTWEVLVQGGS